MKKWIYLLLLVVALFMTLITGVYAPVLAITYEDIYKDFRDYEVSNYDNIPIVLNENTFSNEIYGYVNIKFSSSFSSCPAPTKRYSIGVLVNDTTTNILRKSNGYDISCTTSQSSIYEYIINFDKDDFTSDGYEAIKASLLQDNALNIRFSPYIYDYAGNNALFNNVNATIWNLELTVYIFYEFNTTYFFQNIALDTTSGNAKMTNGIIYNQYGLANSNVALLVAYNSNDYLRVHNIDYTNSVTRGRKKYNVDLDTQRTAYGIGVGCYYFGEYISGYYTISNNVDNTIYCDHIIHLLNYSNPQTSFPGADTIPLWNYDTCDVWDIPCHLGNALVYLAKDAPITSDIYQIASSGWQFISNGFYAVTSLFGANFDENGNLVSGSAFGVLLLISLGILLISWGVSGDD